MNQAVPKTLAAAAEQCGCNENELSRFNRHLESLPLYQAARINPFSFAEAAGIDPEKTLDLFVHGAKTGIFDLEWGMVCPLCGAITHSVAELDRVAEDIVHCSLCRLDVESVLDDTVEVSFSYSPPGTNLDLHSDFATYQHYFTSSSYPYRDQWRGYHERHTIADARIDPGGKATLPLRLQAGETYRVLCLDNHSGAEIRAADVSPKTELKMSLSDSGFSPTDAALQAGESVLEITNDTDQPVWCRVLRIVIDDIIAIKGGLGPAQFGPRLTGKHLLNNQAFRDNFSLHELAPDLKLKLRSLTLLFTDLKGSTALYDREGDLAAYRLVQDHFEAIKLAVRHHSGAMIKTMGDAVMAAFPSVQDGTAAAISMMTAMNEIAGGRRDNDVGLKVGLHAGPALAINSGQSLDYFGQTVNIAARVQGLADAGDICLTKALNDDGAVPALLAEAGYDSRAEMARLKGVSSEEQVYRYHIAQ